MLRAEHGVMGTAFHLTLCAQSRKNTPRRNREYWGREEITAKEDLMHFRFSRNTCCLATALGGLTSKYKKAMQYEFQKWTENGE